LDQIDGDLDRPGGTALAFSQLFSPGTAAWLMADNVAETVFDREALRNRERSAEENWNMTVAQYQGTARCQFSERPQ